MPRKKQIAPPDQKSAQARVRKAIADKFSLVGATAFTSGMVTAIAYSLLAIASPSSFTDAALTQFLSSLSANWLSQIVWELRGRMERRALNQAEEQETIRQLSEDLMQQLSDRDLGEVLARLGVIETTLRAAEAANVDAGALTREMLLAGIAKKEDINLAIAQIRPSQVTRTQINTAINSTIITLAGDHGTVIIGETEAQRREYAVLADIKTYRAQLVTRHAPLDLRGLDIAAQASAAGGSLQLKLESVYTPLFTRHLGAIKTGESARINPKGIAHESNNWPDVPLRHPAPPSRFRLMFEQLLGTRNRSNETPVLGTGLEVRLRNGPSDLSRSDRISIIEALNDAPRAIILGKGGSGKSTVLKHIVLGLCDAVDEFESEWRHGPLLPIWVTLREYVDYVRARSLGPSENAEQERARAGFTAWLTDDPAETLIDFIVDDLKRADGRRKQALPNLAQELEKWLTERGGVFLLDGLDEVPSAQRLMVRNAIAGLAERFPRCRYIVACRPYSYRDAQNPAADRVLKIAPGGRPFTELDVLPLDIPQIAFFVEKWYSQLADVMPDLSLEAATRRAGELVAQIEHDERLRVLAETPLLLTLIGSLHGLGNRRLPNERWELLKQTVDLLLVSWQRRKRDNKGTYSAFDATEMRIHEALDSKRGEALLTRLYQLAYDVHAGATKLNHSAASDITEQQLMAALRDVLPPAIQASDLELAQYLRDRAGLILDEGGKAGKEHVYRFPHRMFQEYLCACHMRESYFEVAPKIDGDYERWQEVYALLALMSENATFTKTCVEALCPQPPASGNDWRRVYLAAGIWADFPQLGLETVLKNVRHPVTQHIEKIRAWLHARISDVENARAFERARVGDALARLGDPRFDAERWFLPKDEWLGFVRIEADPEFRIGTRGSDFERVKDAVGGDDASRDEINDAPTPTHAFYVARYPVTVAQFRTFVVANASKFANHGFSREPDNRPVGMRTWHEAMAYCSWLDTRLKGDTAPAGLRELLSSGHWRVTLPSELEWEKAARGGLKDAIFSWSDEENPIAMANYLGTGIDTTSSVGCFPKNGYELYDMIGNVWEWTRSGYKPYPYDVTADLTLPNQSSDELRVRRGGAFYDGARDARCAARIRSRPGGGISGTGFRVVLSPAF